MADQNPTTKAARYWNQFMFPLILVAVLLPLCIVGDPWSIPALLIGPALAWVNMS